MVYGYIRIADVWFPDMYMVCDIWLMDDVYSRWIRWGLCRDERLPLSSQCYQLDREVVLTHLRDV